MRVPEDRGAHARCGGGAPGDARRPRRAPRGVRELGLQPRLGGGAFGAAQLDACPLGELRERSARAARAAPPPRLPPRAARARTRGSSRASRKRSSPTGFSRLRSTSAASVSRSAPQTSSAASSEQPPAKTARRAKSCARGSSSRSWLHSIAARSVRWRSGASRGPPVSSGRRVLEPLEQRRRVEQLRARGGELDRERQPVQPAADRRHASRWAAARARPPRARSTKSVDRVRVWERLERVLALARTCSGARLVTSRRRRGAAASSSASDGRGGEQVLDVVEQQERVSVERRSAASVSCAPSACAIVGTTSSGSRHGRRAGPRRPRRSSVADELGGDLQREPASCPCRPGPVTVTSRLPFEEERDELARPRVSRSSSGLATIGRLVASSVFSGGNSSTPSW